MKKKIQTLKENKGFSLIELIIVIAIMAILVGIIGTALIPYMEKSRAGKDKTIFDGIYTAYASVITEAEDPTTIISGGTLTSDGKTQVESNLGTTLADTYKKFKSKQFKNATISFYYNSENDYGVKASNSSYNDVIINNTGAEYPVGVKKSAGSGSDAP